MMRGLLVFAASLTLAGPVLAGPVTLKDNPVDDDGRVTFGDLFEGAGAAASVMVAERAGPSVVLEAGQLQGLALRAGLDWSNPQGLRRVVVRRTATAATSTAVTSDRATASVEVLSYARNLAAGDVVQPEDVIWTTVQAHQANAAGPQDAEQVIGLSARRALRAGAAVASRDLVSPQVIARNDPVEVAFVSGGVRLTVHGRAQRNAARGEPVSVLNPASGKIIEAVATGPGTAVTGPQAHAARAGNQTFASNGL